MQSDMCVCVSDCMCCGYDAAEVRYYFMVPAVPRLETQFPSAHSYSERPICLVVIMSRLNPLNRKSLIADVHQLFCVDA